MTMYIEFYDVNISKLTNNNNVNLFQNDNEHMEPTTDITQTLPEETTSASSTHSSTLSVIKLLNADYNDLQKHRKNSDVQQSVLDEYLLLGFQMVQKEDRELRLFAPTLKLLLEFGAKWKDGVLLEDQMTPHHLICQSNCDNAELLDLVITCFDGALINNKSHDGSTALLYAVQNANLKCVKSLIANGANVNLEDDTYPNYSNLSSSQQTLSPIVETIRRLQPDSEYSSIVMTDIFDLLLDNGVDVNKPYSPCKPKPIEYAIHLGNVQCIKKLIEKGARLGTIDDEDVYIWSDIALIGSVDLLKCMLDHGIDKDCTDMDGQSLLSYTVLSRNVQAIRYLLDLGVNMTSSAPQTDEILCMHCGKSRQLLETIKHVSMDTTEEDRIQEPHMVVCELNVLDLVQLLEEYGNPNFKSMNTLRHAVKHGSLEVVTYLLGKHNYPLNVEYARKCDDNIDYRNILIEACWYSTDGIIKVLLDHGADPNKSICNKKCSSAMITAIVHQHVEVVAQFIQRGVDINFKSYDQRYGNILPFEASVLYNNICAAKMLLISGCFCGVLNLNDDHEFKIDVEPELEKLMKKWNVHKNNVTPLQIQCRRMILMHLSPKALDKIDDCSLPLTIVKYLSIRELDDIVEDYIASNDN